MKLTSIQSLRALAALLVLVYHTRAHEILAMDQNGLTELPLVNFMIDNGYSGVDLFFVISGFIMVYVTGQVLPRPMTSLAFLFARAARIYPLWWFFAGLMMAYFYVTYGVPLDPGRSLGQGDFIRENPVQHLFLSLALLPQPAIPVYGLGWTLVHEMHFYLVFALIILLPRRFLPAILTVWAIGVFAGAMAGLAAPHAIDYVSLAFHPLSLEFIGGCFAGLLVMSGRRFNPPLVLGLAAAVFIAGLIIQGEVTPFTMVWGRVLWFGLPAIAIVYALASMEANGRLKVPGWMVTLGDWSYAIYLCHILVLSVIRRVFLMLAAQLEGTPYADWFTVGAPGRIDNILFYLLCISLSILTAGLVFRLFETPVIKLTSKARRRLFRDTNAQLKPAPVKAAIW